MGNLGLWDRECFDSLRDRSRNIWRYRALGTSLGTKVYLRIRWRSGESDDVSEAVPSPELESVLTSFSWGQSAGSVSVSLQMVTNGGDTEGLFRAAFMQSGSPPPTTDITAVGMHTTKSPHSELVACRVNHIMISSLKVLVARAHPTL